MLHNRRHEAVTRPRRRFKPVRPLKRKRLTLIAAFRCGTPDDPSVVVCADSQETCGHYRVEVKKIDPRDAGNYDLIVGGSGEIGCLIDELSEYVERDMSQWQDGLSEEVARERLSSVLRTYHANQVALYPASDAEKELRFIVCARDKKSGAIYLWQTDGTSVRSVRDYALIGWEEDIYKHQVKQFYRPDLSLAQTVLLSIDLISVGIKTSNYIGGPIQVIVARKEGVWSDYPEDVKRLEGRIERFNEELGRFALACLDVSMPDADFEKVLRRFETQITLLRTLHAQDAARGGVRTDRPRQQTADDWQGFPYPKYSFEALVDLVYGSERIQRAANEAREASKDVEETEAKREEARLRAKQPRTPYAVKVEWVPVPKEILDPPDSEEPDSKE